MVEQGLSFSEFEIEDAKKYAANTVPKELDHHPDIQSIEGKLEFIKSGIGLSYQELAEILPSGEDGEVDQAQLNFTFSLVSLLDRKLLGEALSARFRNPAPTWDGKTLVEVLELGCAELALGHYSELFDWEMEI